ncbi:unnamed protein product [Orchesella dallaii]|uniref:Uncharacterized protein n=1 Tax=Orchesella dallaii TaxID=48710 RepID=A0ABP1PMX6_9HEXA
MDPSDAGKRQEVAESIKQKRLSDDTTSNSSSESEEASSPIHTHPPPPPAEKPIREWDFQDLLKNDDKMQEYLESFAEIRGRYTRADPAYAAEEDEEENTTPPIVLDYRPRLYGRPGGNQQNNNRGYQRGGGRGSFIQNSDRQFGQRRSGGYQGGSTEGDRLPHGSRQDGVADTNQPPIATQKRRLDHSPPPTKPGSKVSKHSPIKWVP